MGLGVRRPFLGVLGSGVCGNGFLGSEAGTYQSIRLFERMISRVGLQDDNIFRPIYGAFD